MPRGGKRPNSGPKPGAIYKPTLEKQALRDRYTARMQERFDTLSDVQYETACGVSQFVYRDEAGRFKVIDDPDELRARCSMGEAIRIFTRLPNAQAQTDILNRLLDKPKDQPLDVNLNHQIDQRLLDLLQKGRERAHG